MNINELLEYSTNLLSQKYNEEVDLASKPVKMEKDDTKNIKVIEPKIDAKELLKKLEDFDLEVLDAIKTQDPEIQFEMIDGKQPLKEEETQLISDEEKEERAQELKKTRSKRNTKPEFTEDFNPFNHDETFRYRLLSRLKTDNNYFLGNGDGYEGNLWAGSVEDQIKTMRDLWNSFDDSRKPEWCSREDIDNYEKEMLAKKAEKALVAESVKEGKDKVVAKYESMDGKHEIIRTSDGLYRNRYFLTEDGKAKRVTKGVKTLPTAVGALMLRFPEATEIK